jgi:hypothetical protein
MQAIWGAKARWLVKRESVVPKARRNRNSMLSTPMVDLKSNRQIVQSKSKGKKSSQWQWCREVGRALGGEIGIRDHGKYELDWLRSAPNHHGAGGQATTLHPRARSSKEAAAALRLPVGLLQAQPVQADCLKRGWWSIRSYLRLRNMAFTLVGWT